VAGTAPAPGPLKVPADDLAKTLGITSVSVIGQHVLSINDQALA
jgi:hypothetical protein